MTIKEAIELLEDLQCGSEDEGIINALKMAIMALNDVIDGSVLPRSGLLFNLEYEFHDDDDMKERVRTWITNFGKTGDEEPL